MDQYLSRYAESEISALAHLPKAFHWSNVIVIPACAEDMGFVEALLTDAKASGPILLILVINGTKASSPCVLDVNTKLFCGVEQRGRIAWQCPAGAGPWINEFEGSSVSVMQVDRFSNGRELPSKGGVGHARKIGADLATWLIHNGHIDSPWIHCTDADARLPGRYFTASDALGGDKENTALIYPFRHCAGDGDSVAIVAATQIYELSLRYYLAGLRRAKSPYAFHTIGSTLAVHAHHYAKVRGFPSRQAGEDFYLLNKLAKLAPVHQFSEGRDCGPIELQSRSSDRTPFGTGAAVSELVRLQDPWLEFRLYHPGIFALLGLWLQRMPELWPRGMSEPDKALETGLLESNGPAIDKADIRVLVWALIELGVPAALTHAWAHSRNQAQFTRQMHTWFDAFRTLKLVHHLRDRHLKSVPCAELICRSEFKQWVRADKDLHDNLIRVKQVVKSAQS